jgi:bifunctional DNase/RNase
VVRASIDSVTADRIFLGHVTLSGSTKAVDLETRAADSIALAMDSGAPIVVAREVLERAGINPSELLHMGHAQPSRAARQPAPAPVHRI